MADLKRSFHGRVRSTAYDLWRGPYYVNNHDEDNPLSGLCILRLAIRRGTSTQPLLEARAVYLCTEPEPDAYDLQAYKPSLNLL